jgi:hypothetical protein
VREIWFIFFLPPICIVYILFLFCFHTGFRSIKGRRLIQLINKDICTDQTLFLVRIEFVRFWKELLSPNETACNYAICLRQPIYIQSDMWRDCEHPDISWTTYMALFAGKFDIHIHTHNCFFLLCHGIYINVINSIIMTKLTN